MDLDEWEILPRDGFIDYHHEKEEEEEGERKTFSISTPRSVFKMNHFSYPSSPPPPPRTGSPRLLPNQQLVPVEIQLKDKIDEDPEAELIKEIIRVPTNTSIVSSATPENVKDSDLNEVAQVFFKKLEENKFTDMKTDSPNASSRGVLPQIDAGAFNFEDINETTEIVASPRKKVENDMGMMNKKRETDGDNRGVTWEENSGGGLNIWKWSFNGIGAICSFGVAAATSCVIILGSYQRNKQRQNQKISFQIYTEDKRMKKVVHHATKLNEAMSAVRGVPLNRAQITTGGYYDGF